MFLFSAIFLLAITTFLLVLWAASKNIIPTYQEEAPDEHEINAI